MFDTAAQRPRFTAAEAIQITAELFGRVAVEAQSLPSERDQNFYIREASGENTVLKIAGTAEEPAVLDFQNEVLTYLASQPQFNRDGQQKLAAKDDRLKGVPRFHASAFPQPLPTLAGETLATVTAADGRTFHIRLLSFLPGVPLAETNPQTPELLFETGLFLGAMDIALKHFSHPAMTRALHWDLQHAADTIERYAPYIGETEKNALVTHFLQLFKKEVLPSLPELERSVIHGDGNDYNILISPDKKAVRRVAGLIDFGDMVYSCTVFEIAIAAAYIMLDKADPVAAAAQLIAGYHQNCPLTPLELSLLPVLIPTRLCTSVAISAFQQAQEPEHDYLSISEQPSWQLLNYLAAIPPALLQYTFRAACGLEPYPKHEALVDWLQAHQGSFASLVPVDPTTQRPIVFDWSVGSLELGSPADFANADRMSKQVFARLDEAGTTLGLGRYDEARLVYTAPAFQEAGGEWRTIHIGLDLFMTAGTPVSAPLAGVVHSFRDNNAPLDYGPTIILQHEVGVGLTFYTLYGHLSWESLAGLKIGQPVAQGQEIGRIGDLHVNGGWPPHLHFQIIGDLLGRSGEFPGVAPASQRAVWRSLCPDPNLIAGLPPSCFPGADPSKAELLTKRQAHLGPSLSLAYRKPLEIVRGWRQYLYDENGRAYLDVVNNVCHVGHSHPQVVRALRQQAAVLNTNTRYLHPNITHFATQLLATLPDPLEVCFFVCSGSEANELALRLARVYTGAEDLVVVDGAYHGNTAALIDISPYKHDGPGGRGAPAHVHKTLMPDPYRGRYQGYSPETGRQYAAHVAELVTEVTAAGRQVAAFICESLLGCGGQILLPAGYLAAAFDHVRAAGGLCIVDEVQVGFGRIGSHFWGFETQGVVPDIVTMGKPIGNGHPLAAVVTTREIADAFANGMEYFNTFGGNPVSCAVGSAVLEVIAAENLQEKAHQVGARLREGLTTLMTRHPLIGDVRGLGLFIGVELVRDRNTLEPAAEEATYIVERMKEEGILLSIDGPLHNVLKLKPPMVFDEGNADFLVQTLDKILAEDPLQVL